MKKSVHPLRAGSPAKSVFIASLALAATTALFGCGGHNNSSTVGVQSQYSGDYEYDGVYYPDTVAYPGAASSTTSSGSGSSSGRTLSVIGTFVGANDDVYQVLGTVDGTGAFSAITIDTVTGVMSVGTGTINSDGSFTLTDAVTGEIDTGTADTPSPSDDSGDSGGYSDSGGGGDSGGSSDSGGGSGGDDGGGDDGGDAGGNSSS